MNVNFLNYWIIYWFIPSSNILEEKEERELKLMKMANKHELFIAIDILILKDIADSTLMILLTLKTSRFQSGTAWVPLLTARFLH